MFHFPSDITPFRSTKSPQELRQKLLRESGDIGLNNQFFLITHLKQKYIYCKCFKCKAFLRYKKVRSEEEEEYKLVDFFFKHEHNRRKDDQLTVMAFIKSFPSTIQTSTLKRIVLEQFQISKSRFYYYMKKFRQQCITFGDLLTELDTLKYEMRYAPYPLPDKNCIPDILLITNNRMLEAFKVFGDVVSIDVTYNCVKQQKVEVINDKQQVRKWGIALFLGKTSSNRPIPLAFAMLNTQTTQSFEILFRNFFSMVGKPHTILSDQQNSIIAALRNVKELGEWNGQLMMDSFHLIRSFSRKLKKNEKLLNCIRDLVLTHYPQEFQKLIKRAEILAQTSSQLQVVKDLISKKSMYCISQSKSIFQGIALTTSYHEQVHNHLKNHIKHQLPAKVVVRKVLDFLIEMESESMKVVYCKIKYQNLFGNQDLKILRYRVCEKIYLVTLNNYVKGLALNFNQVEQMKWVFKDQAMVHKNDIFKKLVCTCNYNLSFGIPCPHLTCIIRNINESIVNYISDRWLIKISNEQKRNRLRTPLGRPRASRRNIL